MVNLLDENHIPFYRTAFIDCGASQNLNHAIFLHPLLATTQEEYDAYETQAIGRIRRYGQKKTVYCWRFLAEDSIDTEIYEQRKKKAQF